jgi:hypothetical protein
MPAGFVCIIVQLGDISSRTATLCSNHLASSGHAPSLLLAAAAGHRISVLPPNITKTSEPRLSFTLNSRTYRVTRINSASS